MTNPKDFQDVISRLKNYNPKTGVADCLVPGHDTPAKTLSVKDGGDSVILHCFGNHDSELVLASLGFDNFYYSNGSKQKSKEIDRAVHPLKKTATYIYNGADGKELYWKERQQSDLHSNDFKDKVYYFYHVVKGERESGRGCEPVLYHYDLMLKWVANSSTVRICEGEQKADILINLGLPATSADTGANSKLSEYQVSLFSGLYVIIYQDNDRVGENYTQYLISVLLSIVKSIKIIVFNELDQHGDIVDWIKLGHTKEDILKKEAETLCYTLEIETTTKQEPESEEYLTIPQEAWRPGVINDYRLIMGPTTEASDNYHFVGIMQILSFILNRKVYVYHAHRLYPNIFVVIVGLTGLSRKDTAMSRAKKTINDLNADNQDTKYRIISAIGSAEGLLDWFSGSGLVRLWIQGEYASIAAKSKQNGTGNLIPVMTELWDCPERYEPKTRGKDVTCVNPYLSILVGSTPEWLIQSLTENDIHGGYANRWMYVFGEPKEPMSNPPEINQICYQELLKQLNEIRLWADGLPNEGRIELSQEAQTLFDAWYLKNVKDLDSEGIIPKLLVRVEDNAFKIALLMACADKSNVITGEHMHAALLIADFLKTSIRVLFRNYNTSADRKDEDRLINMIKIHGKTSQRELYRLMNLSGDRLNKLTGPLLKIGLIREIREISPKNHKETVLYELA